MKKRWLSIILCMLMLLSALPATSLAASGSKEEARMQALSLASDALQTLMAAWKKTSNPGLEYPDDVAGLYITDDQKAAVVLVRGATEARKNEIRALVPNPAVLVFKSAKYSYNELEIIKDNNIDSDGTFELVSWGVGQYEKDNAVMVEVYYGGKAAARRYFAQYGDKVKVTEGERHTLPIMPPSAADRNESWLRHAFPKLRSLETTQTRFVFASAPEVVKTRAVLNKKGESLTIYRFETEKDTLKANAMIKGNTLVYGGKTVYVDTLFPATYYVYTEGMAIALYCGADEAVNGKLQETYAVAGGYGGYFDKRYEFISPYGNDIVTPPKDEIPPASIKALLKQTDGIYIVKVAKAPAWGKGTDVTGAYELEVTQNIKGVVRASFKLDDLPGVMYAGRSYVLFTLNIAMQGGGTRIICADWVHHSAFEIDDRGYVLPIREYGMKAPVKLAAFLRKL